MVSVAMQKAHTQKVCTFLSKSLIQHIFHKVLYIPVGFISPFQTNNLYSFKQIGSCQSTGSYSPNSQPTFSQITSSTSLLSR